MKKYYFYFSICIGVLLISIFACKRDAVDIDNLDKRLKLTKDKSVEAIKDSYMGLSNQSKKELWIEKIQQLLNQRLPSQQFTLISELEKELLKYDCDFTTIASNSKIRDLGIKLASITPREDFLAMFVSLEDYTFKDNFTGKEICKDCINDMENETRSSINSLQLRTEPCNCNWTCGSA